MRKIFRILFALLWCLLIPLFIGFYPSVSAANAEKNLTTIGSESQGVIVSLRPNGTINSMSIRYNDGWHDVLFRNDDFNGPGFGPQVMLKQKEPNLPVFLGEKQGVSYQLSYVIAENRLQMKVVLQNDGKTDFEPDRLPFILGINSYMDSFPLWNDLYFPTFLRCEPTHFWGYMMTPSGKILGIACKDPVDSYTTEYQREMYNHYIYTASLDLMQKPPVPDHHPVYKPLVPGEKRTWMIELMAIDQLDQVKPILAKNTRAPMFDLHRYTLEPDQDAEFSIFSTMPVSLTVTTPAAKEYQVTVEKEFKDGAYGAAFSSTNEYGYYDVHLSDINGNISTGSFFVRPKWSWYIQHCRSEALRLTPRADLNGGADGYSCETYYGLLGFYLASKHFPDEAMDIKGDHILEKVLERLFREENSMFFSINSERIQNGSFMLSVLVDRFEASGDIKSLEMANKFAEYLISRQHPDGYYGGYGMHPYTSVLYVAKSIMELMEVEKKLGVKDPKWMTQYHRHYGSVKRAIDDLVRRGLDVKTEGQGTFEDGAVSCSVTQIALFALLQKDPEERQKYIESALQFMNAHSCLTRLLSPDTRSNGSTIRWWEAWNDNKVFAQMTTSPHGWSGWRIYGVYYMYLLTGEEAYLRGAMNALGACSQLMEWPTGILRQAYVVDPNVEAVKSIPDPENPFGYKQPYTYGEEYLTCLSHWYGQSTKGNSYTDRVEWGWTGDGIPYEIFKAMEEIALTAAYVIERKDGTFKTYNCRVEQKNDILEITPSEDVVNRVHLNLQKQHQCKITFANARPVELSLKGMQWIGPC